MSPVWSMSSVHSSAFELPFRHSIDSTVGDFAAEDESDLVGESVELFGWPRSMVIFNHYKAMLVENHFLSFIICV